MLPFSQVKANKIDFPWLIDEEAAAVVHRIFRLTIEGKGPYDIARILFEDKVETLDLHFS